MDLNHQPSSYEELALPLSYESKSPAGPEGCSKKPAGLSLKRPYEEMQHQQTGFRHCISLVGFACSLEIVKHLNRNSQLFLPMSALARGRDAWRAISPRT